MTADHLLPANATPLEQALSLATDPLSRLALPADAIRLSRPTTCSPSAGHHLESASPSMSSHVDGPSTLPMAPALRAPAA